MVRVMASGVFDLLHPGHVAYLEQAKGLGDELYVVVACDETVRRRKHEPITPGEMRVRMVSALKPVDVAVLGVDGDMMDSVKRIRPDIIALGFDQKFDSDALQKDLESQGLTGISIVRLTECSDDLNATRRIVERIRGMQ